MSFSALMDAEPSPASAQYMIFLFFNCLINLVSNSLTVFCSFVFPGYNPIERGIPFLSINSPISTIGLGLCSLEGPYFLKPGITSPVTSSI